MFSIWSDRFWHLMDRGGPVMWLLLTMSVFALTLILERAWFWFSTHHPSRTRRAQLMAKKLREGDVAGARVLAETDGGLYGQTVLAFLDERVVTDVAALAVAERHRPALDRFMPTLSSIITGAPLLGLIGTVVGLINTFNFMGDKMLFADPRNVGLGLAEALLNTVAGLIIALMTLFPYNMYRAQVDRALGRIEMLAAAALQSQSKPNGASAHLPEHTPR